ncbi:MAG: glycosyltransferase, partial [Flavobacteriaceae bacterium]
MVLHLERKFTSPTETFIVNQINAIASEKHSVFTIVNLNNLEANAAIYAPEIATALSTKILRRSHKAYFEKQLKTVAPTCIHAHFMTDAALFHPLTKKLKVPKICSCYGYDVSVVPRKFGIVGRIQYKKLFREYDIFLAMSEVMKKDLLAMGCPAHKIRVHYHGINTKLFATERDYQIKDGVLNLLTIASLLPVKGHMAVLKALKQLKTKEPKLNIHYNLVGQGRFREQLENYVVENGLSDSVCFCGPTKHGPEFNAYLKKADIFLHPSTTTEQ